MRKRLARFLPFFAEKTQQINIYACIYQIKAVILPSIITHAKKNYKNMKKYFLLFCVAVTALTLGSCRGPMGPMGPATFNVPELTADIYDNGIIKVYREWGTGTKDATQAELPFTRYQEYLADELNNTWGFYSEHVDYDFLVGALNIYYTASDFDYELNESFMPEGMHFRVIMMW